jgi:hypothetical protein
MAKADVISLVNLITLNQANANIIDRLYDEAVKDLANMGYMSNTVQIASVAGTATYTLPTQAVKMLNVSHDDRPLAPISTTELNALNSEWRDEVGKPYAYTFENENAKTFRVYPKPPEASDNQSFGEGSPEGVDYPINIVDCVITETRTDVLIQMELALAFLIIHREYTRESKHTDVKFATLAKQIADLILGLI